MDRRYLHQSEQSPGTSPSGSHNGQDLQLRIQRPGDLERTNSSALFQELAAAEEDLALTGDCKRNPPSDVVVRLLEDLFRDPCFTRVWILQEFCAKDSAESICGSASFTFEGLRSLYSVMIVILM
jgi:hypothetical protein